MRSHFEFRSDSLLDVMSNEGIPRGEKISRLLAEHLPEQGFRVQSVEPEDWGWKVQISNEAFPLWIGCGHYEEYADGHLCFIEPSKPYVRRWLKRISTSEQVERLAMALENVVRSQPGTYDARWWADADAARG
jgi:hypothetical protein